MSNYGMSKTLTGASIDEAEEKVTAALKEQGFGVLTRIDVQETLKTKIDADFHPYRILGACNPPLALEGLGIDADIGLMLPCNVVVEAVDGGTRIGIIDPKVQVEITDGDALDDLASRVRAKLAAALDAVG